MRSRSNRASAPNTWKTRRPLGVVVSIASVKDRRPAPLFSNWFTVSIRCGSERVRRSSFQVTRTSPSRTKPRACAKSRGDPSSLPMRDPRKSGRSRRREAHRAGDSFPAPASKPVDNRSGPSRFSRTRPCCRPTIRLSGLPLSSIVSGQGAIGRKRVDCRTNNLEDAMARGGLLNDADRKRLFGAPDDDDSLNRFYSLSDDDGTSLHRSVAPAISSGWACS
jgi:hypothetical protein